MTRDELIARIADAVEEVLRERGVPRSSPAAGAGLSREAPAELTSAQARHTPLIKAPLDGEALQRMMKATTARIGVGRAGPRLNTRTLLTLRVDHAKARDAVLLDVEPAFLNDLGLFSVQTRCRSKDEFLTRPDLGRLLSEEAEETLRHRCTAAPDVQIFVADGLSSLAVMANVPRILPVLTEGLRSAGLRVGTPFFVRFGRVAVEDHISEILRPRVVCALIGERPGLGSAESLSAYIAYEAAVGMAESRRTVVSNIHKDGINAAEAGAYIAELIGKILEAGASGVELQR